MKRVDRQVNLIETMRVNLIETGDDPLFDRFDSYVLDHVMSVLCSGEVLDSRDGIIEDIEEKT